MSVLTKPSMHVLEGISLFVGVIAIISSVLYFLNSYGYISIAYQIPNETLLIFFVAMTAISGIMLISSTVGMIGLR